MNPGKAVTVFSVKAKIIVKCDFDRVSNKNVVHGNTLNTFSSTKITA